jgi:pyruvate dehydrogenase E2 component (dihydrolipoamide acetyltransferase)
MVRELKLPELGEGIEEADVLKVLVAPGDLVSKDQPLLEIETDKATVEVPAAESGRVSEVKVSPGDRIRVGQVLVTLSGDRESPPPPDEEPEPTAAPSVAPEAVEAESSAETAEPPGETAELATTPAKRAEPQAPAVPAAPSVRRLARELGVDVAQVEGGGPGGRVGMADVMEHARAIVSSAGGVGARPTLPDFGRWGVVRRERLTGLRRAAASRLTQAWTQVAHVTHHDLADVTETESMREKYAGRVEAQGGKLTFTALAVYIASAALKQFPRFNASIDLANEEIVYKEYCHNGVAADTERGLVVPVVRNADRLSLAEIAIVLTELAERARSGKLKKEDMEGSSFTVTNLGGIGGVAFTPIVNWPEVAILGVSRARWEPVWREDSFEPRFVLPLSLSYDHRLIDGADAARFVRFVAEAFEHPLVMSLMSISGRR